ncbi:undecaprenyl-diphosphate phosphatase [Campylobacter sp. RM10532]|uniref:undecaprenyl-diphosphate phosphatase n=1 Tax=Campylobacter TaxID=194 RepID=UPI001EFA6C4D|nr:undecaprenyl-diphosphate phosphatase [Campylobacter sp. RM10537]MBZ7930404.1 undecaprenyl-diphosphate phosphatase [Campylobacter sp. W0067]MBZ7941120.1 undecaprenyl-diphosphate phosphatase [Campylobacter sp. W0047]MBZ7945736.1 undecaprenyl-diphosphate phosphatase [Campylobacter sp. RM10532]MBZ7950161.1 undecaprenyl-diphosphate phosphatase [Campylobacter sp. RM10534]MBZ7963227.1 undecaprenyl-diphosphate phosphatase [Campylobacter sp. W0049]
MENFYALILGIIEGLTEFLPVSSTGHMILGGTILGLKMDDFWRSFLIIIQLGSILAVIFVFWKRLIQGFDIWFKLAVGFFPTGLIGLFAEKYLKELFNGYVVVSMLIIGGIIFIIIEKYHKNKTYEINSLDEITYKKAFCIGIIQSLAIIPGTSRSGSSIIGGLLLGLNRKSAAEFSFLLAVPTMIIATLYKIYKEPNLLSDANSLIPLSIGFITAFVVAVFVIKFFLKFITKFNFIPFGIYRIILGILFFYLYYSGILNSGDQF